MSDPLQTNGLPESRLYTFIDEDREFALYFLEGQRLIHDLALTHAVHGQGFAYFREVLLSIQPMIALLKRGEQFGFYIDSEAPYFRLKIETGHHGASRCALFPDDFRHFPPAMKGIVRLQKLFPNNRAPYQSVLEVDSLPLREIVNRLLTVSYQTNSAVLVSEESDQSVLLHQLPPIKSRDEYDYSMDALRARRDGIAEDLRRILARALLDPEEIRAAFARVGFRQLADRPVAFRCSCSRDRVLHNLMLLGESDRQSLFEPSDEALEVKCEYCKSVYDISRTDLENSVRPSN